MKHIGMSVERDKRETGKSADFNPRARQPGSQPIADTTGEQGGRHASTTV